LKKDEIGGGGTEEKKSSEKKDSKQDSALEQKLAKNPWVGGKEPSKKDAEAFTSLNGGDLDAETAPHTFAWFNVMSSFSDEVR
jgi:glutathione S-transferase